MQSRLTRLSLALAGCLVVAGCDSASPSPAPLPKQTPSPTASATVDAAPTMPAAAKGTDAAAAKAFARHYFDVINYASRTGDTANLRKLGAEGCQSCGAIADNIEKTYRADGRIQSAGWQLRVTALVPQQPKARPILDLGIRQSPETVYVHAGAKPRRFPGGKQPMTMYLLRGNTGWMVTRLDLVAS